MLNEQKVVSARYSTIEKTPSRAIEHLPLATIQTATLKNQN